MRSDTVFRNMCKGCQGYSIIIVTYNIQGTGKRVERGLFNELVGWGIIARAGIYVNWHVSLL